MGKTAPQVQETSSLVPSSVLHVVSCPHEDHGVGFARAGVDVPNTVERE